MSWEIISDKDAEPVVCPKCGNLLGFIFKDEAMPEVKAVRFTIGDKQYPPMQIEKFIPKFRQVICRVCGYKKRIRIRK